MKRILGGYAHRGYEIRRGAYSGTSDNRIDRWYVDPADQQYYDRRGEGYATLADARQSIDEISAAYCASAHSMARCNE